MKSSLKYVVGLPLSANRATMEEDVRSLSEGHVAAATESTAFDSDVQVLVANDSFSEFYPPYSFIESELQWQATRALERERKKMKAAEARIWPDLSESSKSYVAQTDSELDVLVDRSLAEVRAQRLAAAGHIPPIISAVASGSSYYNSPLKDEGVSPTLKDFIRIWIPRYAFLPPIDISRSDPRRHTWLQYLPLSHVLAFHFGSFGGVFGQ